VFRYSPATKEPKATLNATIHVDPLSQDSPLTIQFAVAASASAYQRGSLTRFGRFRACTLDACGGVTRSMVQSVQRAMVGKMRQAILPRPASLSNKIASPAQAKSRFVSELGKALATAAGQATPGGESQLGTIECQCGNREWSVWLARIFQSNR